MYSVTFHHWSIHWSDVKECSVLTTFFQQSVISLIQTNVSQDVCKSQPVLETLPSHQQTFIDQFHVQELFPKEKQEANLKS